MTANDPQHSSGLQRWMGQVDVALGDMRKDVEANDLRAVSEVLRHRWNSFAERDPGIDVIDNKYAGKTR